MFSKERKYSFYAMVVFLSVLSMPEGLAAQAMLQRGGVDVNPPSGRFGLDVGVGLAGIGDRETSSAYSLTPSYEVWRRGGLTLDLILPVLYLSQLADPGSGDLELERDGAVEIAPGVELGLAGRAVGSRCCLRPSFFLAAGYRFETIQPAFRAPDGSLLPGAQRTSPLVTAGAALDLRWLRHHSLRFELRVTTVFERGVRLETGFGNLDLEGETATSGLVSLGWSFDF